MFWLKIVEAAGTDDICTSAAGKLLSQAIAVIVNPIITLFFIMASSIFAFGVFEFIKGADEENVRTKGKEHMKWGVVGLFIMISVFAIIKILINTFGLDTSCILR